MIEHNRKKYIQILKFFIVGGVNTMSSLVIYYILLLCNIEYSFATICGYIGSSIIGYILNKIWVFESRRSSLKKSLVRYYIVYGTALLINLICMHLWIEILEISKSVAPILTLFITIPYNFLLSKFWIFRKIK